VRQKDLADVVHRLAARAANPPSTSAIAPGRLPIAPERQSKSPARAAEQNGSPSAFIEGAVIVAIVVSLSGALEAV
jgi:hypothetical protein